MNKESIMYWESHLEALERTKQYIDNSLKLVEFDIASCKRRIEHYKSARHELSIGEAMNYKPVDAHG